MKEPLNKTSESLQDHISDGYISSQNRKLNIWPDLQLKHKEIFFFNYVLIVSYKFISKPTLSFSQPCGTRSSNLHDSLDERSSR